MTAQELFDGNIPLVHATMNRFRMRRLPAFLDKEDVHQVGLLGLWEAAKSFDPMRGVAFSTFATRCIVNKIEALIVEVFAKKRGNFIPHAEVMDTVPSREEEPSARMEEEERLVGVKKRCSRLLRYFSPRRRAVLRRRFLDGLSWQQIAEEMGYASAKTAQNASTNDLYDFRNNHPRCLHA